jgi:hypothetical protein
MARGAPVALAVTAFITSSLAAHAAPGVKGSVTFDGPAPERTKVRRDTDPYCAKTEQLSDDVIVTNGKLKDVLVRIKNGSYPAPKPAAAPAATGAAAAAAPAPAVFDQKDCAYSPHVIGVVAGQPLVVRNSDGTFHNVHGTIAGKLAWNKPAAPGDSALTLDNPAKPGDVIEVVCDVHPWMHAYAVVQDHTKFAVTGEDGAFEIPDLRPGTYTIEAWHPVLGLKSTTVKIGAGARGPASVKLTYARSDLK